MPANLVPTQPIASTAMLKMANATNVLQISSLTILLVALLATLVKPTLSTTTQATSHATHATVIMPVAKMCSDTAMNAQMQILQSARLALKTTCSVPTISAIALAPSV